MAKTIYERTPESGQIVSDDSLRIASALKLPVFSGLPDIGTNPDESGYIGVYNGDIWLYWNGDWINKTVSTGDPGGGDPIPYELIILPYDSIFTRVKNKTLITLQKFLMTDHATSWKIGDVVYTGAIEPIILTAATNETFFATVQSLQYPRDLIEYDFNDNWETV